MKDEKIKIAHVSSVHGYKDIRIFMKECQTLSNNYKVHFLNKDFEGNIDGVFFNRVRFAKSRLIRIFSSWFIASYKIIFSDYKIVHFHDPELMPAVPIWKLFGKKVIMDVHENFGKQLETKSYILKLLKPILKYLIVFSEVLTSKICDAIIVVHKDLNGILNKHKLSVVISNAPLLDYKFEFKKRKKQFCYVGLISEERGVLHLAKILNKMNIKFILAGNFSNQNTKKKILSFKNVEFRGWINSKEKQNLISESVAGCCTFLPIEHHLISNPNKIYEYLNYGTPVLCSDFKSYKEIIPESYNFIYYSNILNEEETSRNIEKIVSLRDSEINNVGHNGHKYILKHYNWKIEGQKLLNLYSKLTI